MSVHEYTLLRDSSYWTIIMTSRVLLIVTTCHRDDTFSALDSWIILCIRLLALFWLICVRCRLCLYDIDYDFGKLLKAFCRENFAFTHKTLIKKESAYMWNSEIILHFVYIMCNLYVDVRQRKTGSYSISLWKSWNNIARFAGSKCHSHTNNLES